ncbi:MAG: DUF411 domain-containing protein [Beutenbergiaceae bacterium]
MPTILARRTLLMALPVSALLSACTDATQPSTAPPESGQAPTAGPGATTNPAARLDGVAMVVAKSPTCGCCTGWIEHAEAAGATVTVEHPADLADTFSAAQIDLNLQACHLTRIEDAVFVGHIPLRFVAEYLADPPPELRGLAVPGMPAGTPGMEAGGALDPYDVIALHTDGSTSVHAQVATLADQEA